MVPIIYYLPKHSYRNNHKDASIDSIDKEIDDIPSVPTIRYSFAH